MFQKIPALLFAGAILLPVAVRSQDNPSASTDVGTTTMQNDRDLGDERLSHDPGGQDDTHNTDTPQAKCKPAEQDKHDQPPPPPATSSDAPHPGDGGDVHDDCPRPK